MIYSLIYSIVFLLSRIPYPLARLAGKLLGAGFSRLPIMRRDEVFGNIVRSFEGQLDEEDCRKILKRVYIHFGQMIFEVPHILRLNHENLSDYVVFENEENLRIALARGKGVFILTAHFGNWELMSAAVTLHFGRAAAVIVRPIDYAPLDRLMSGLRSRFGTEVIAKQGAMRRIISALREQKMIGILLDQNVDWYEGVFTPFMGRWACTNKGLALMAVRTGAPVVPVFSVRENDGRHRIIFEKEVPLVIGDKTTEVEENTILFTQVIESFVRRYPDQWFWFHRRWKTRNFCTLT